MAVLDVSARRRRVRRGCCGAAAVGSFARCDAAVGSFARCDAAVGSFARCDAFEVKTQRLYKNE